MNIAKDAERGMTRRNFGRVAVAAGAGGALLGSTTMVVAGVISSEVKVHRFDQTLPFPVNSFIIEGADGLVVVDATLTNTASLALRAKVDGLGKPLRAVLLTHPHPDHYAGLGNLIAGLDVPIVSVAGVNDVVRRDDATKNEVIGGMFGAEWPSNRVFPTQIAADGEVLNFGDGLSFEVRDIGPAESFHDSLFILAGQAPRAFAGDLAYALMHPYMADNQNADWRKAIARLQAELPEEMILHVGHGPAVTPGFLSWQSTYLDLFEAAIEAADWSDAATAEADVLKAMSGYLPDETLQFLMQLSIAPNAQRLGKI